MAQSTGEVQRERKASDFFHPISETEFDSVAARHLRAAARPVYRAAVPTSAGLASFASLPIAMDP